MHSGLEPVHHIVSFVMVDLRADLLMRSTLTFATCAFDGARYYALSSRKWSTQKQYSTLGI